IRAPQPGRGRIGLFDRGLLFQTAVAAERHEYKACPNRGNKKCDGRAGNRAAGAGIAAIHEKRKQREQPRYKKHQPEANKEYSGALGRLRHTTILEGIPASEMGRKYRFVLVVTTGYAAFRTNRVGGSRRRVRREIARPRDPLTCATYAA